MVTLFGYPGDREAVLGPAAFVVDPFHPSFRSAGPIFDIVRNPTPRAAPCGCPFRFFFVRTARRIRFEASTGAFLALGTWAGRTSFSCPIFS